MRLLCADYSQSDLDNIEDHLQALIYPKSSHMDFNIAAALHFASKCEGFKVNEEYFEEPEFKELFEKVCERKTGDR